MTYGRSLNKAHKKADIPKNSWHDLTQDREAWRSAIKESLSSVLPIRTKLALCPAYTPCVKKDVPEHDARVRVVKLKLKSGN